MTKQRLPYALIALGMIGMALYPRVAQSFAPELRTDFALGFAAGLFLAVEILGVLILRRRTCRGPA
jgi:hypothetical protein